MFFITVIFFGFIGAVIGMQFADTTKTDAELTVTAWALVGVIAGCGVSTYIGII